MTDNFSDLTEDQRRRVNKAILSQVSPYQQQLVSHKNQLRLMQSINTASQQDYHPEAVVSWKWILISILCTIIIAPHALFLLYNMDMLEINWIYSKSFHSKATMLFSAFIYGCFVCCCLLYIRISQLQRQLGESQAREQRWQAEQARTASALQSMRTAAGKITVPYSLDRLVEMGINDFAEVGASKRSLRALPVDN